MPKSRDHGQGALYWDAHRQFWRAVVDVGFDPTTGKRRQLARSSKSKDEAVKKLNAMLRERDTLGRVLDRSTRVRDLAERWLEDISRRAKPKTLAGYRSNVRSKLVPTLGKRLVAELTPTDIRRLHAAIRQSGAGDASVSSAHRTLVTILEYARSERILMENVAILTPPRRMKAGKAKESLTRAEAQALLRLQDARWTLGLLTGIRSGEARGLRWQDIDLNEALLNVSWSMTEAEFSHGCNGGCGRTRAGNCPQRTIVMSDELEWDLLQDRHVLVRPKNGKPRQLPLTAQMVAELRAWQDVAGEPNPHQLVWHRPNGAPLTNTDDNGLLSNALRKADVDQPHATTHWLRHSYVTLSEHAGIPWAAFAGVSGHSTPDATDPYRHVLTDEGRQAVESLASWIAH